MLFLTITKLLTKKNHTLRVPYIQLVDKTPTLTPSHPLVKFNNNNNDNNNKQLRRFKPFP